MQKARGRNSFQSYIVISACGQGWNLMALMCPSIENKSALQNGLLCMCIQTCIYSQQLAVDDSMTPQSYQNSPFNSLIPPPLQNCFYCNLISIDTFVTPSGEDVNFAWVPLYRTCSAYSTKLEIIVTRSILSCLYNTYSTSKSMLLNLHKHMQQQWYLSET